MRQAVTLGWSPGHPKAICQNLEVLRRFTQFTYEFDNVAFIDWFEGRTGVQVSWCPCGWDHIRNRQHRWFDAAKDAGGKCNWENKKQAYCLPAPPNEETWRQSLRGQMQDAWELWHEHLATPVVIGHEADFVTKPELEPVQLSLF
jgi:hypothetical protein